jgi:hypothetical protein
MSCNERNFVFIQSLKQEHFSSILGDHQFKLKMAYPVPSYRWLLPVELHGIIVPEDNNFSLGDWLTVHSSITLFNFQLDAQNSLFIYI